MARVDEQWLKLVSAEMDSYSMTAFMSEAAYLYLSCYGDLLY